MLSVGRRPEGSECERFEVLHDGGKMELVARAREPPEPHPLEAVVGFQVGEAHLDTLSFVSRSGERLCLHLPPSDIAGVLVEVARDLARVSRGAALRSERAYIAVELGGAVEQRASVVHSAAGPKQLTVGAYVNTPLAVPAEVRA